VKKPLLLTIIPVTLMSLLLLGLSCAPQTTLDISVTELDNGIMIENVGNVDCLVFVTSPEGEQQFELDVGQDRMVTDISQSIEVSAVGQ
jgi:hypothetical protein